MPSVQYMNNSAPFWDWVASLEQNGMNHPWFSQWNQNQNQDTDNDTDNQRSNEEHAGPHQRPPFGPWGFPGFGGRSFPYRHPHDERREKDNDNDHREKGKDNDKDMEDVNDNGEGPSGSGSETEGRRRRGHCSPRRGRHCGGPRGFGGPGPHHGPPHGGPGQRGHYGPRGHRHGRGGFGPWGGPWGRGGFGPAFNPFAFASSFLDLTSNKEENSDFTPEADIFDTPSSFIIHVSLPGAKKEDVGVNWDVEKSELSIAGVIYRPGDEEFLKTLAMDERKVGPFERKVRLGTRANPAAIDADGITAKLEDGVLRVEVPKMGDSGFVEVRKVDIE